MSQIKISLAKNIKSYSYAIKGLSHVFLTENNMRYHAAAAITAIYAGIYFQITAIEWLVVILSCGLVFTAEIFNTVIEKFLDLVMPDQNHKVGLIKDMSAAGVLVISITAFIIGLIIFLPKIFSF